MGALEIYRLDLVLSQFAVFCDFVWLCGHFVSEYKICNAHDSETLAMDGYVDFYDQRTQNGNLKRIMKNLRIVKLSGKQRKVFHFDTIGHLANGLGISKNFRIDVSSHVLLK